MKTKTLFLTLVLIGASRMAQAQLTASPDEERCLKSAPDARYMRGAACPACVCPKGFQNSMARGGRKGDVCELIPDRKPPVVPPVVTKVTPPAAPAEWKCVTEPDSSQTASEPGKEMLVTIGCDPHPIKTVSGVCIGCGVNKQGDHFDKKYNTGRKPVAIHEEFTIAPVNKKGGKEIFLLTLDDGVTPPHREKIEITWPAETKTVCENGSVIENGDCVCPANLPKRRKIAEGSYVCEKADVRLKVGCEATEGAKISSDGKSCLCPELVSGQLVEVKIKGRENEPGICMNKAEKGDTGDAGTGFANLVVEAKGLVFGSQGFKSGGNFCADVGPAFHLSQGKTVYGVIGICAPGSPVTDKNGRPTIGADGKADHRDFSAVLEGGMKSSLSDAVGLRFGVLYLPFGISNGIKFTHAGLGPVVGVDMHFPINKDTEFLIGPAVMVGAHLQDGRSPQLGYAAMLNLALGLFKQ